MVVEIIKFRYKLRLGSIEIAVRDLTIWGRGRTEHAPYPKL